MNKSQKNFSSTLIKALISMLFLLSVYGKWAHFASEVPAIADLFYLSPAAAEFFIYGLIAIEIGIIILVWVKPVKTLLLIPVIFLLITIYSQYRSLDCGCFGNLAIISQLPLWGHVILIFALFAGFLSIIPESQEKHWLKQITFGFFLIAGVSLFFPTNRQAVEPAVIASIDFSAVNQAVLNQSALLIDARSAMQYNYGTIGDAINIPHDVTSLDSLIDEWGLTTQNLIVFCSGPHCEKAEILAKRLQAAGCDSLKIYSGGWDDWVEQEAFLDH